MKNKIQIELNDWLYQRLLKHCGGDVEALKVFIVKVLSKIGETSPAHSSSPKLDTSGLQEYLQSSQSGTRDYGIKGQGW